MALNLTVTDAGRAEIINASNTGTAQVTVTHVALGRAGYQPTPDQTTLQDEIKRVDTIAGDVVADDTISVTVKDEGADAYSVHEIGLISDQGTLLAVAAQDAAIIEKTRDATLLLVSDLVLKDLDANSVTFGDVVFLNPPATETVKGVVELADETEALRGDDAKRAITPARVHQAFRQYGLGGSGAHVTDVSAITESGFYALYRSTEDAFPGQKSGDTLLHVSWGSGHHAQIGISQNNELFFRYQDNGTWKGWNKVWHARNMGPGSGLNADMVDGIQASELLTKEGTQTITLTGEKDALRILKSSQNMDATAGLLLTADNDGGQLDVAFELRGAPDATGIDESAHNNSAHTRFAILGSGETLIGYTQLEANGYRIGNLPGGAMLAVNGPIAVQGHVVWHAGNMGPGSGLNADKLDGQHIGYFRNANNLNAGMVPLSRLPMGPGKGLDADTVDGLHATFFAPIENANLINPDINSAAARTITFDNREANTLAGSDGTLAYDASQGLLIFRDQQIGDASGAGFYTVLDRSNIRGGDNIVLSGNTPNETGTTPLTIDVKQGPGSGLNADAVDGLHGDQLLRSDANQSMKAGASTVLKILSDGGGKSQLALHSEGGQGTGQLYVGQNETHGGGIEYNGDGQPETTGAGSDYVTLFRRSSGVDYWTARNKYNTNAWEFRVTPNVNGNDVWHQGNMGPGSRLNADMVDGKHASQFLRSDVANPSIPLENKEQQDITVDGEIFWDKSAGIYIQSSNANHNRPALAWTSANVTIGNGLSVNYDSEDKPSLNIPQGSASGLNADLLDGYHAQFFRDAGNLINGTLPKGRLAGTYNINIAGSADQLDGKHASSFVRSDAPTRFDVGRGVVNVENHAQDNQDGAGITLRTSNNPGNGSPGGDIGSIFAVRSSGDALRLWVGQSVTSTGDNDFETKKITATGPIYAQGGLQASGYFYMMDYDDAASAETGWETYVRDGIWHIRGRRNENHALDISLGGNAVWHQGNTRNAVGGRELADNTVEMRHMRANSIGKNQLRATGSEDDWVARRVATRGVGWLGTYAFLECLSQTDPGVNRPASALRYSSSYNGGARGFGQGLSGTWKCMGRVKGGDSDGDDATLWLRIA
ncbi:phage tail-collar fiber domain-containing protein [Halomonas caseinilytica]|uniref:phage tail-collar fiber domain-containing protein n=1 Tax=Halomonas caseinilytica TaxID=438744 RepID=UPI0007E54A95|nr:phage tail protein [Halomonas caseinilytica]SEM52729.1 hypothetical protein SAMN04487952_104237 [Halomonas caseinilytica]